MKLAILAIGTALIAMTVLSRVRSTLWWIRAMDFPRSQVAVLLAVTGAAHVVTMDVRSLLDVSFGAALAISFAYQVARVFPYTRLAPRQVHDAPCGDKARSIRLLVSNVLMENRRASDFLALVREVDPDVVLAVETDGWWAEHLRGLEADYPHVIKQPQGNHFGMHFFSRLALDASAVRYLVEADIPSIRVTIQLRSGDRIELFGLHPRPAEPQQDTDERDAELLMVGKEVRACALPAIVAGDLNDVAWSNTTRLFQKVSGLLDPRRGRGMFSTFHASYPLLRWPLDHVFHDKRFTLVQLRRLRSIGSDHFPVFAELQFDPPAAENQTAPKADQRDIKEAGERIADIQRQ
ncbi:MAG: endonuclease/exonuclease/phosphatase family protein [Paracoccaceae bacterium]